jgi:hypothetical protein
MHAWPKLLTLVGLALLQQIGSVDLTRPAPPSISHNRPIPAACKNLKPGGIADGWIALWPLIEEVGWRRQLQ